jgi:hypothetical protein
MSESTGQAKLFAALASLQADLPRIAKDASAKITPDGKPSYSYKYADLADVAEAVMPLLGKHGLAFTAKPTMDGDRFVLVYKLVHESGEFDEGAYPLPDPRSTKPQTVGSAITYARRYCLTAVTGVAPNGDDDDASAAQNDFQSAGAAFEAASPVRPSHRNAAPEAVKPATTDGAWLDGAIAKAAGTDLSADECRALWRDSAEKVRGGSVAKEDAKRVQDLLKARIEDLGREAKAKAALDPEDSWSVKIESLASSQEAASAVGEVLALFHGGEIGTTRRDTLIAAVAARFPGAAAETAAAA